MASLRGSDPLTDGSPPILQILAPIGRDRFRFLGDVANPAKVLGSAWVPLWVPPMKKGPPISRKGLVF